MSTAATLHLQPLDKKLRGKLEATVKEARDVAEEAARAACNQVEVGLAKTVSLKSEEDKDLRRRLRIHGRQLGDTQGVSREQQVDRLVEEIAYEHWHRMLFARFLAENQLLMYPDPDGPVAVSLDDCEDLAANEGVKNGWELAARFATKMLPQIFPVGSPVFELTLAPEMQQRLEQLLAELPSEVFTASDSLGWVYQFWQAKRKDQVNASGVKIGSRELPAVTQLFTEHYMVLFMLHNTLGAWHAAKTLTAEDTQLAGDEVELRQKVTLRTPAGDCLWTYLRFERDVARLSNQHSALSNETPGWRPISGTFAGWPRAAKDLKVLDPCCGSGHFLIAALKILVQLRIHEEGLTVAEAVDAVLCDNLHGLEIDERCCQIAAFNLAIEAWKLAGYRKLPELHIACSGIGPQCSEAEWLSLAEASGIPLPPGGLEPIQNGLLNLHHLFSQASTLGSLIDPTQLPSDLIAADYETIRPYITAMLRAEKTDVETWERAVAAAGMVKAVELLARSFVLVITNVPYLGRGKQDGILQRYAEDHEPDAKSDLATMFISRSLKWLEKGGSIAVVSPQNWFFQPNSSHFRKRLLTQFEWNLTVVLGEEAWHSFGYRGPRATLTVVTCSAPTDDARFSAIDVAGVRGKSIVTIEQKMERLTGHPLAPVQWLVQSRQIANPDHRVILGEESSLEMLSEHAIGPQGIKTGDDERWRRRCWEMEYLVDRWKYCASGFDRTATVGGLCFMLDWLNEGRDFARLQGRRAWGGSGVSVRLMGEIKVVRYFGTLFDSNVTAIVPTKGSTLSAIVVFCESDHFPASVKAAEQTVKANSGTATKVPFDLAYWQQVAAEKYPYGLPEPYSDDPTQWLFHGHPASSEHALQVAVARLLGYRWPAELDAEMELAADARVWVERSSELTPLADGDGIVCIPAVGTEQPADVRLLNLLHKSYEEGRSVEQQFQLKLDAGDTNDPLTVALLQRNWQPSLLGSFNEWLASLLAAADHTGKTLDSWLRDKFFTQHFKRFHHRPFIWHVWDGLKDGFSVLVNYHRLDNKLLETLIYTYLNDWIKTQKNQLGKVDGSQERLDAANALKAKLELILAGESPLDIFVRWKTLDQQPIGWNPDLNDGVRLNIRPWMTVGDVSKKGAGVLRDKPNIEWKKDRGKDVESAPWFTLGPTYGGKVGDRINDHHLTLAEKRTTRK